MPAKANFMGPSAVLRRHGSVDPARRRLPVTGFRHTYPIGGELGASKLRVARLEASLRRDRVADATGDAAPVGMSNPVAARPAARGEG
ncbi:hypothetical protein [Methylobacterium sp. 37f]|uniref:hypothetical protein n=1 Tax=Methylobacterium sp. 37f TaxID=2817058 RepID=UPI001FFC577F|nr:hypothetical protein [Methylobacterium sp. 37f]MCK2053563.1 hypothetical protein [Methylobacterium sp. 37f]